MTNRAPQDAWFEDDHVEGGFKFLEQCGRPRDDIVVASAGVGASGEPQVLVLGPMNVEILDARGAVILDVGQREVRGLRLAGESGVQLCITPLGANGIRDARWTHEVSAADARFLEKCWLEMTPFSHTGIQLNRLPWREEEYAHYVGRVLTEASRCDTALVALVLMARGSLGLPDGRLMGASGEQLADALEDLGTRSPAVADIGVRYRAWYQQRNFVAHGIRGRDAEGRPTGQVFKTVRGRRSPPDVVFEIEEQDFRALALVWRAFYALGRDAFDAMVHLGNPGSPEEALARLPMPNTVGPSERLPSSARRPDSSQ